MVPSRLSPEYFLITTALADGLEQNIISPAIRTQTKITKILSFMFLPSFLAYHSRPRNVLSFVGEKPLFPPETTSIPDQPAVAADNSVAGDDDGNGIPVVGLAAGPPGLRPSHRPRHLPIRRGLPIRDPDQLPPSFFLKLCTLQEEVQRKFLPLSPEVFVDLRDRRP